MTLSRRGVLHGFAVTAGGAAVALPTGAPQSPGEEPRPDRDPDPVAGFPYGWRFLLANTTGADEPEPAAGDHRWREVALPHDWSIALDPVDGPHTTASTGFLPGGLGWYRKEFTLPPGTAGRKVYVEFDGVYMDAEVRFNGVRVGRHPYGYTGFELDLTPWAHTDGHTPNVLVVRVCNRIPSSRWYSGSGIYRAVRLRITDPVHLVRHGVVVTTPEPAGADPARAAVRVQATAVSEHRGERAEIAARITDAAGTPVARGSVPVRLDGRPRSATLELQVDDPVPWSTEQPYLYTLHTDVTVDGRITDTAATRFGIRRFAFHPQRGFSLNGRPMKLRGVNLHHDLGALGAACHPDAIRRRLELMRSMGVNALRTAHNPPAPELIALCEELGLLMLIEAFDSWRTPKNRYDYSRFFDEHSDADLREMVAAARNSPAVVLWSIGNEIPDAAEPDGVATAQRLISAVRESDPTRPVVIGSHLHRRVPADGSPEDRILRLLDGIGLNYNTAASVDALHEKYPDMFLFESESASVTSARGVYDRPDQLNTGENHTPGRRGPSSFDNNLAPWTMSGEYSLKKDRDREFFAGQFLWSGADYLGEPTPYRNVFPVKASFFGAVDTAGFPKDLYYLFRSQWTHEPMVHLVPMDWTRHTPGEPVTVWAYSNVPAVELLLNGRSLGERRFDTKTTGHGTKYLETTEATGDDKTVVSGPYPGSYTSPNGSAGKLHLTWRVPFEPGELVAVARRDGTEVARDTLRTAGPPAALRLLADRERIEADGHSLCFVTAEVTDARGVTVPGAAHPITFRVTGGELVGTDSGRQESAEPYRSPVRSAYQGRALAVVRSGHRPGTVALSAFAPGLRSARLGVPATAARRPATPGGGLPTATTPPEPPTAGPLPPPERWPLADADFSGARETVPAAMLDGDPTTAWSNHYRKRATALLPEVGTAREAAWVSLTWPRPRRLSGIRIRFLQDEAHRPPARITVARQQDGRFLPVPGIRVSWAAGPGQPTFVRFGPVRTTALRLELTSARPGAADGFLGIVSLDAEH